MNVRPARWLLVTIFILVAAVGCSPAAAPPSPTPPPTPGISKPSIDYVALEAEIEKSIATGPETLDNVRAVLVNVGGETKIAHYRHGFGEDDHGHVFSVTKSVLSILIGIAIADGLIADIDQPLVKLLPKHREAMSGDTAKVTLRHLMTMSGGFNNQFPGGFVWEKYAEPGASFVNVLLERRQEFEPGKVFWYSDVGAHLVAAVLAAALERADGDRPRTVLDYAREKLFDPLGIPTHPAFSGALPDLFITTEFVTAGFGWGTDPNGIQLGGYGLRLSAPDMMKIGELYRRNGVWNGQQIVPPAWIHQCTSPSTFETKIGDPVDEYGLLWWIIGKPKRAGYYATGFGGQRIIVLPKSGAVIVYMSDVQPDSQIDGRDLEPLDNVFVSAFL
jgi:CubicO group peptidase (beta-lactamase class C family)